MTNDEVINALREFLAIEDDAPASSILYEIYCLARAAGYADTTVKLAESYPKDEK